MVPATDRPSQSTGAEDPRAGGLDWLQSLARPAVTATGEVPAPPRDESSLAPKREQSSGGARDEAAVGGMDWLGDALRGAIPSTAAKRAPGTDTSPIKEENGPESSAGGDDWLAIARSGGQNKRKSPLSLTARHSVAASSATQGGWMSSGKLGLPTEDDSDDGGAGTSGGGGGSTTAAPAKPKKHKRQAGHSTAAGEPTGWLGSGALGVPTEDGSDQEDGGIGDGGGEDDRGVGVTVETQTEDDIQAVVEKGTVEKQNVRKLPPWAKPWVPPSKPEVPSVAAPKAATAAGGGSEKEVIYMDAQCLLCSAFTVVMLR